VITLGDIGPGSILLVAHTFYEKRKEEIVLILSARAAESHEEVMSAVETWIALQAAAGVPGCEVYSAISDGSTPIARTKHLRILITVPRLSVRRGFRVCLRSFFATVVTAFAQISDVSANPVWPGVNCRHEF
jgi:hypothetical protein